MKYQFFLKTNFAPIFGDYTVFKFNWAIKEAHFDIFLSAIKP